LQCPERDWLANLAERNVHRPQGGFEVQWVHRIREQINDWNELTLSEPAADEPGVSVAALLAIRTNIDAGSNLGGDREPHGIVAGFREVGNVEAAFELRMDGPNHPPRPGPGPDAHDG
jgi:hypothetical protein